MTRPAIFISSLVFCLLSLGSIVRAQDFTTELDETLAAQSTITTPSVVATPSSIPPSSTPIPVTNTPIPPTPTVVPATATSAPLSPTAIVPTATAVLTATSVPVTPTGKPTGVEPSATPTLTTDTKGGTPTPATTTVSATATSGPSLTPAPTPTFVPGFADLALAVHVSSNPVRVGQVLTFFITVTNHGGATAPATRLVMSMPGGATPVSVGPGCFVNPLTGLLDCSSGGSVCTPLFFGGNVSCSLPSLAPGATSHYAVSFQVIASSGTIYAVVQVDPDRLVADNDLADNTVSVAVWIIPGPIGQTVADLALRGSVSPNPVRPGEVLSYFITVVNHGGVTTPPTRLVARVPVGTSPISLAPGCFLDDDKTLDCQSARFGPSCGVNSFGEVDCPVPSLTPGAAVTYVLSFQVFAPDGAIFADFRVDPDRRILESDEDDNAISIAVEIIPVAPYYPPPPAPLPLPTTALPPAPQPAPPGPTLIPPTLTPITVTETWLYVLQPTTAFSPTMDPVWTAQDGEWYRVRLQQADWALVIWEYDPPQWQEWIQVDLRVAITRTEHETAPAVFLLVHEPTPVYSPTMDLLWTAELGERYRVRLQEGGWLLVIWEHDPPEFQVWIQVDLRVEVIRY